MTDRPCYSRTLTGLSAAVGCCIAVLFLYKLADRDLWSSHEARAAQDAQTIIDTGDWLLPRQFDGHAELQKPPLYYWLVTLIGKLQSGDVDAWAERLPAAIAALGTVALLFGALRQSGRPIAAIVAALILATAQHFTWIGRTGRIDVPLTLAVTSSVLGLHSKCVGWQICGYVALAAGVLLKGPIGIVLPTAILSMEWAFRPRTGPAVDRGHLRLSLLWGVPLVLALSIPWFVVAHLRTDGEFTRVFFWYHHVQRATGSAATLATHPWWTYLVRWSVDPLPWSPLIVTLGWAAWRTPWLREDPWARLGCVWMVSVTVLLSLSKFKRADYLLPAYPGFALAVGCLAERACNLLSEERRRRWLVVGTVIVCAVAVVVWSCLLNTVVPALDAERTKQSFAKAIRQCVPVPEEVLFFRVEDHLLAFHLGRPTSGFLEWENLEVWAGRSGTHHIVMPAECAAQWRQYISSGTLEELIRFTDRSDRERPRDLVLVQTNANGSVAGDRRAATTNLPRTDQHGASVLQSVGGAGIDR
jgi:4-amino-4-deoxy-L-arabinose transferase-like glycosyltransferase